MQKYKHNRPTIGILSYQAYSRTLDSFLENVFRGILAAAHDRECNLLLSCGIGPPYDINLGRIAWPLVKPDADFVPVGPWNTDGLVAVPPLISDFAIQYMEDLLKSGFPVMFAGDRMQSPAVIADNEGGIRQAIDHLIEHGHRRIAFISGRSDEDSYLRLNGYQAGLLAHGVEIDPDLIEPGFHTTEGGHQAVENLLKRGTRFTAVMGSNDVSAVGAMDALREAGLQVPRDVAVIGFDDRIEAKAQIPPLTSVHFPMFEVGYQAVEELLQIIDGKKEDVFVRIPIHLVIRGTCGCLSDAVAHTGETHPVVSSGNATRHSAGAVEAISGNPDEKDIFARLTQSVFHAVQGETQCLTKKEVEYLCQSLILALKTSLQQGDISTFQLSLRQILERVSSQDDDLFMWQKAITLLRESMPALLKDTPTNLPGEKIEDMFQQARVMIGEIVEGQSARQQIHQAEAADQVSQMASLFFAARDEDEIYKILARTLPLLGIQHVTAALYEAEGDDSVAWTRLITPQTLPHSSQRFPTRHFPPPGIYPETKPFNLAILPFKMPDNNPGFIAFDARNLEPCASIVRQLEAALRDIQLYRQAVQARRYAEMAQELAEEANRMKSRFLSMVSHELRTPLNLISGLSDELLQNSQRTGADQIEINLKDLERIYITTHHLEGLIRDVFDLARIDVGQLNLVLESLDLKEVLNEVRVIGEQLAVEKGLTWRAEITNESLHVRGDRTRLRQVVLNLVNNAVKFTVQGEIILTAIAENDKVRISVSDTGLGIPTNEQNLIFDEFRQSTRTSARGFGGLGLGLAICQRLVEKHGGEIGVCSSGEEGQGSTFYFTLPRLDVLPAAPAQVGEILPAEMRQILLLVKDAAGGEQLKGHLSSQGLKVDLHAEDETADWMSWLLPTLPDAVILDLGLTQERGWEILRVLKENSATRNLPVLFYSLTGDQSSGAMLEMDYMTKPIASSDLAKALAAQGLSAEGGLAGAQKSILIVDDDPNILDLHVRLVKSQSPTYRILKASNGREALNLVRQEHPDLVLLDLIMPEMDGFAVLEAMRAEDLTRKIPVIVVTGQTLTEEDMLRLNNGVASVLGKGMFSVEETLKHITTALEHKRKWGSEAQRTVLKAVVYIHAHYAEPITRRDVADFVGLSERHLTRCFRQEMGITPITYLNRFRINQAKVLLALPTSGKKGITEIALDVGFSSSGYFTRVFRQEVGVAPSAFVRGDCADVP
jgi:signal transduction histidine kinase/DNA-binding response OmpR family regulator